MKKLLKDILGIKEEDVTQEKLSDALGHHDLDQVLSEVSASISGRSLRPGLYSKLVSRLFLAIRGDKDRKARIKIFQMGFDNLMKNENITPDIAKEVLEVLSDEVGRVTRIMETADIVSQVYQCLDFIKGQQRSFADPSWLELFRTLVSVVYRRDKVVLEDDFTTLTGIEFRCKFLEELCATKWHQSNATHMCSMLKDLAEDADFSQLENATVMTKLCSLLKGLRPNEMPPLVYQILKLSQICSNVSSLMLISTLSSHYCEKLKFSNESDSQDSIDEDDKEIRNIMQSEGTVMYHICDVVVTGGHPIAKDIPKIVQTGTKAPELVLDQFLLFLSLAVSSKISNQAICDSLKSTFVKNISIQQRRCQDAWFRTMILPTKNTSDLVANLIKQTCEHGGWDLIADAILAVAISLLDMSSGLGKPDTKLKAVWRLGKEIILNIASNSSNSIKKIVDLLSGHIISSRGAVQYTECLKDLIKNSLSLFVENPTLLHDIADYMCSMSPVGGRRVFVALLPVIKINKSLRNNLILMLRKGLFSRSDEMKQIAVTGVLFLMQIFKIASSLPITQMSQSSSSLSQLASGLYQGASTSNENLCNELIGVLRRGLTQCPIVRQKIYQGLTDVLGKNPELCNSFLELMLEHAVDMGWVPSSSITNNIDLKFIDLDDLIFIRENKVLVEDPVGWFFHCVLQIVTKWNLLYNEDEVDEADVASKTSLFTCLTLLTKKYAEADLLDLNFEKNAEYNPGSEDGEKNIAKVNTTRNIYEALLEFAITQGTGLFQDPLTIVIGLHNRYIEQSELLKSSSNTIKGGRKKKDDKENKDATKKKNDRGVFKQAMPHSHAFSLRALSIVTKKLLLEGNQEPDEVLVKLRERKSFVDMIIIFLREKAGHVEKFLVQMAANDSNVEIIYRQLSSISVIVKDFIMTESEDTWLLLDCGEIFLKLLDICTNLFPKREEHFIKLSSSVVNTGDSESSISTLITKFLGRMEKVVSIIENEDDDDDEHDDTTVKFLAILMKILTSLSHKMNSTSNGAHPVSKEILEWCHQFGKSKHSSKPLLMKPYVELFLSTATSVKIYSSILVDMAKNIHHTAGDLDETIEVFKEDSFQFISKDTMANVLNMLCDHLDKLFDSADLVITYCKQLVMAETMGFTKPSEQLPESEKGVCMFLANSSNVLSELCVSNLNYDTLVEHVFKTLVKFYTLMDKFTSYVILRCKTSVDIVSRIKFDQLVINIEQNVSSNIDLLTNYVEKLKAELQGSKKSKSNVQNNLLKKEGKFIIELNNKLMSFHNSLKTVSVKTKTNLTLSTGKISAKDFRLDKKRLLEEVTLNTSSMSTSVVDEDGSNAPHFAESTRLTEEDDDAIQSQLLNSAAQSQSSVITGGNLLAGPPSKKLKVKITKPKS